MWTSFTSQVDGYEGLIPVSSQEPQISLFLWFGLCLSDLWCGLGQVQAGADRSSAAQSVVWGLVRACPASPPHPGLLHHSPISSTDVFSPLLWVSTYFISLSTAFSLLKLYCLLLSPTGCYDYIFFLLGSFFFFNYLFINYGCAGSSLLLADFL